MNGAFERADMLTIRNNLPDGLLDCTVKQLAQIVDGPTLIELDGEREAPLFISILIHGNEDVGLGAVQQMLRAKLDGGLPRSLMLLIGNVAAAAQGQRRLEGQPDYNRIWPGASDDLDTPEARMMAEIHQRVIDRGAFAAIDLHNNTGRNPYYSVVCKKNPKVLGLASMFTDRAVLFRGLPGTQTASFGDLVPAITAECGKPGSTDNEDAATNFLCDVMDLDELPHGPAHPESLKLHHTLGVIRVRSDVSLGFGDDSAALNLDPHLDRLNFSPLSRGTLLGLSKHPAPLEVIDEDGRNVFESYFGVENEELRLCKPATPAMLTVDASVVRQDCLGYLMEPVDHF